MRTPALVLTLLLALSCASAPRSPRWDFFAPPGEDDVWFLKVAEWQERAVREADAGIGATPAALSLRAARRSGELRAKMGSWRDGERRRLAQRIHAWTREEARRHYAWDPSKDPTYDHWPTLQELLETNGDDCDGLDLIAYQLLREFGFAEEELYRLIVQRQSDGANHMVTLWFEDPADPWVFDATGAMTLDLVRFSSLEGWTPTKMFNERAQYRVLERPAHPLLVRDP